jgi:hypothetical protein
MTARRSDRALSVWGTPRSPPHAGGRRREQLRHTHREGSAEPDERAQRHVDVSGFDATKLTVVDSKPFGEIRLRPGLAATKFSHASSEIASDLAFVHRRTVCRLRLGLIGPYDALLWVSIDAGPSAETERKLGAR